MSVAPCNPRFNGSSEAFAPGRRAVVVAVIAAVRMTETHTNSLAHVVPALWVLAWFLPRRCGCPIRCSKPVYTGVACGGWMVFRQ